MNDNLRKVKDDLKGEMREVISEIAPIGQAVNSIKTWAKVAVAVLTVVGAIVAGVATGVIQNIFGI